MNYDFLKDIPGTNPKPEPRRKSKARAKRVKAKTTAEIRQYVFARERDLCRCCRKRKAESMHEIVPRGRGGKVSKKNSIAVCGQLVGTEECCHTYLQQMGIEVYDFDRGGAEQTLHFRPMHRRAADWLGIERVGQMIESPVMFDIESAE